MGHGLLRRSASLTLILCAALGGLMGCRPLDAPVASRTPTPSAPSGPPGSPNVAALTQAQRAHEFRTGPPPAQRATGSGGQSPVEVVGTFAHAYINWNAYTVSGQMTRLAAASVGQARSAMQLAAAQTAQDYELQRGGIANHGTVQAVAPLRGSSDRYVVVTLEATTATLTTAYQGLRPAWHVAVARVKRDAGGDWVLSGWQPEN